ncbi:MAG: hypothetical protein ACI85O_000153 [Saprospiraceae bacterium]|jgi:hypothetical protein
MKKIISITLFTIFLSNFCLQGQSPSQTIRGVIIDEDTQIPLIGATVTILNSNPVNGTTTDIDGVYRLEGVSLGRVNLAVSYIGYQEKLVPNIELNSAKEIILDIALVESTATLEEVVVTASNKKGAALNESALVSARSISAEQTSRYPGGFNDPAKITGNFAGVTNTQDGGNDIIVRGNSPKYVQWRLEGAEITNPNHFGDPNAIGGSVGALNNNLLSTSDFYTGAFPSEFGDALSGVYDIRMRKGNNEKYEGIFGFGLLGTDITVEGPFKKGYKGSFLANFRYSTIGLAIRLGFIPVEDVSLNFQDAAFKLWLPTKKTGIFSVFGFQGASSFQFLDINPGVLITPGSDFAQTDIKEDFEKSANLFNIGVNHTINVSSKSYLKTTFLTSIDGIQDEVFDNLIAADSTVERRLNFNSELNKIAYKWNTIYHYKLNAHHKLSAGFQYTAVEQNNTQSLLDSLDNRTFLIDFKDQINSLRNFLSWKYIPNDQLSFVVGIHNTNVFFNDKYTVEPRFAVNYELNSSSSISGGYGLHSRMESTHNYFTRIEQADGTNLTPNLDLGLLKASHYVVGYEKYFSKNLKAKVELYYQHLYNIPVENNPNSPYTTLNEGLELNYVDLVNEGTGKNYGIELTFERFLNNGLYFLLNTSIYESKYTALDGVERNTRFNGNYLVNVLAGKEFSNLGKKNNQTFAINIKAFFGGGRYFIPLIRDESGNTAVNIEEGLIFDNNKAYENKLDNLQNIVFSLTYKWNKKKTTHELFLNIDNLTNNQARLREFYDATEPNGVAYERQVGIIPNFLYRIYF